MWAYCIHVRQVWNEANESLTPPQSDFTLLRPKERIVNYWLCFTSYPLSVALLWVWEP